MRQIPQRTCTGCMQKKNKNELIRIVKNKNGEIHSSFSLPAAHPEEKLLPQVPPTVPALFYEIPQGSFRGSSGSAASTGAPSQVPGNGPAHEILSDELWRILPSVPEAPDALPFFAQILPVPAQAVQAPGIYPGRGRTPGHAETASGFPHPCSYTPVPPVYSDTDPAPRSREKKDTAVQNHSGPPQSIPYLPPVSGEHRLIP